MREQISEFEMDAVCGGKCYMNGNTGKLFFTHDNRIFQLDGVDALTALGLMNSFLGKCDDDADYDAKCIGALQSRGWIKVIGTR